MIKTNLQRNIEELEGLLPFTRPVRNNPALVVVLGTLALTAGNEEPAPADDEQFRRAEALAVTAYAIRNSDIVEDLHAEGTPLTDGLMPRFTGEIARRLFDLLEVKALFAGHDKTELWRRFVVRYQAMFCRGWQFFEPVVEEPTPAAA